jgi:aryl-alcohol dehydrogenase-like predicted oxidoreductase
VRSDDRPNDARRARLSRRDFLGALAGVAALAPEVAAMQTPGPHGIPVRPLGRADVSVSIVGYGGWDCVIAESEKEAIARMHLALDEGITFWDNAWEYHEGRAEEVMGRALDSPSRRDRVFLMTKVCARDYEGARRQIEDSLRRLRTDRVDLLQFHAVQYADDPERIFDPEKGGLRAALEARKAGKVRYLGFSGHRDPRQHLLTIGGPHLWDTVQMPLNLLDAQYRSFEKEVLPVCRAKGIAVLGMKSLAGQDARLPRELGIDWELCRRYAMSLPVATTICGMQSREEVRGMVRIARGFTPLAAADVAPLLARAREAALKAEIEEYKDPKGGYGCSYHSAVLKA